jgi:hypothetical protein
MAADTAIELRKHNVASLSLWPGLVETELMQAASKDTRVYILSFIILYENNYYLCNRLVK